MTEHFGQAIKKMRKDLGVGMSEMSRRTGLARSYLYELEERLELQPSADTLNRLAIALEVDPEDLYDLAWQTIGPGSGPGLPSLPTYFRTKYQLGDEQIESLEEALRRVIKKER